MKGLVKLKLKYEVEVKDFLIVLNVSWANSLDELAMLKKVNIEDRSILRCSGGYSEVGRV